jgi:ferric-dicitrate binding protein FerR (iron transport regulator)
MKEHQSLSKLAASMLADEDVPTPVHSPEDDARAIRAIEGAIRASAQARRRKQMMVAVLAVAATVAVVIGWRAMRGGESAPLVTRPAPSASTPLRDTTVHSLADGVVVLREGRDVGLDAGAALRASDRIVTTSSGRASITLPSGTHLVVERGADVALVENGATQSFALNAGGLHADVAKLHPGERFIVRTPDAEIEVRGTSFQVDVVGRASCGRGAATRVVVTEGIVAVRFAGAEANVRAGESWPADCFAGTGAASGAASGAAVAEKPVDAPQALSSAAGSAPVTAPGRSAAPLATPPRPSGSDLAAQNALFAEGAAARRRGDTRAAVAAYDKLTSSYPASPLAESATVERMRVVAAADPRRGAEAARAYLARYPAGFARAEANAIVERAR